MKTLLLVDGSSYLYRAFYAMPNLRSPDNEPTSAIYGVANMLQQLTDTIAFDFSACIFDAAGKTFRTDLYAPYKANRPNMPDELIVQVKPVHQLVSALGWFVAAIEGVEADDVIGTLAKKAQSRGWRIIIATGDKDFAQLVNPQISLINTMNGEILDESGVQKKFGVPPGNIIDYLALIGDKSDNVPGIETCGPKTAIKWLNTYGNLANIIACAEDIEGVVGIKLRERCSQLPLFRQLITIKCDVDLTAVLPNGLDDLRRRLPHYDILQSLCQRYSLHALLTKITSSSAKNTIQLAKEDNKNNKDYQAIVTQEALLELLNNLMHEPIVSLDTETTSLDPLSAQLVGISFSWAVNEAYYLPLMHQKISTVTQLDKESALNQLRPWLESIKHKKVGQNLKYDKHVLANENINLAGIVDDTLLASYVLESHLSHNLDDLAKRHLNYTTTSYEAICGKGAKQIPFANVPIDVATHYAAEDADIALQLNQLFQTKLSDAQNIIYRDIELPISNILFAMERHGVLVNTKLLAQQSYELSKQMLILESKIYQLANQPFNINSPKQLQAILFERLGMPTASIKKTPTGHYSTNEITLEKLAMDYPIAQSILVYRTLAKIKSTYTDKLPLLVNQNTGRIHTNYAQAVVITGRLASNDPNLQNIPIKTTAGRRVREAFIAAPNCLIVSVDYSQIELRVMAHLSQDSNLCEAFANGQDIHQATAAEVFGVNIAQVTDQQRNYAKSINFGLIYGMGVYSLAKQLAISQTEAKQFIDRYFMRYPQVARYMERTRQEASIQGYVDTIFGRRLYQSNLQSVDFNSRTRAERAAINAPIQGTAADLIKLAMIATDQWLNEKRMGSRLIMQVHDELVLEVPQEEILSVQEALPALFANVAKFDVPLVAKVGVGNNWEAAH